MDLTHWGLLTFCFNTSFSSNALVSIALQWVCACPSWCFGRRFMCIVFSRAIGMTFGHTRIALQTWAHRPSAPRNSTTCSTTPSLTEKTPLHRKAALKHMEPKTFLQMPVVDWTSSWCSTTAWVSSTTRRLRWIQCSTTLWAATSEQPSTLPICHVVAALRAARGTLLIFLSCTNTGSSTDVLVQ